MPVWRIDVRYFALIAACVIIPATIFRMQGSDISSEDPSEVSEMIERQVESEVIKHVRALQLSGKQVYPPVKSIPASIRKRILVTGGAGFVGSHLVDRLMSQGHQVFVMDNFFTGSQANIAHWMGHPNFQLIMHDVTEPLRMEVDQIYHLACPASPPHYQYNPIKTIKTSTMGTLHMLGLARRVRARMLFTSTSEIYGDPKESPQKETYWGNVNTIGPRACYDEGKRVAETMMYAYRAQEGVDVRVARIFNTFGPRMNPADGRVVSNFIMQALQGKDITIYGDGRATRSFQYVDDLVEGLLRLMEGSYDMPVNLGNPDEYSIERFARLILTITGSNSSVVKLPATQDDPQQRRPDITVAKRELGWEPKISVRDGLKQTIEYFQGVLNRHGSIDTPGPGHFAAVNGPRTRAPQGAAAAAAATAAAAAAAAEDPDDSDDSDGPGYRKAGGVEPAEDYGATAAGGSSGSAEPPDDTRRRRGGGGGK